MKENVPIQKRADLSMSTALANCIHTVREKMSQDAEDSTVRTGILEQTVDIGIKLTEVGSPH